MKQETQRIFQYMSMEKCLSILRNGALPLRNFLSYNDPFECLPEFASYADVLPVLRASNEDERKQIINDQLEAIGKKFNFSNDFIAGLKDGIISTSVLKFAPISIPIAFVLGVAMYSLHNSLKKNDTKEIIALKTELFYHKLLPKLLNLYTSCFTTRENNILMWSHYAQSHHGVVMQFDTAFPPFSDGIMREVKYNSTRFDFAVKDYPDANNINDMVLALLSSKGLDWSYEQEWRLIYDIKKYKDQIIWRDNYNNPVVKLDLNSIKKIYIGRRVHENDILTLKGVFIEKGLDSRISIRKARLSHAGYKIEIL